MELGHGAWWTVSPLCSSNMVAAKARLGADNWISLRWKLLNIQGCAERQAYSFSGAGKWYELKEKKAAKSLEYFGRLSWCSFGRFVTSTWSLFYFFVAISVALFVSIDSSSLLGHYRRLMHFLSRIFFDVKTSKNGLFPFQIIVSNYRISSRI